MHTPRPAASAIRLLRRSLIALSLLASCAIQALAQSPWIITNSSPHSLGAKATQLENEYYRVEQWGFLFTRSTLWHDVYYYPTTELNEAGVFDNRPAQRSQWRFQRRRQKRSNDQLERAAVRERASTHRAIGAIEQRVGRSDSVSIGLGERNRSGSAGFLSNRRCRLQP